MPAAPIITAIENAMIAQIKAVNLVPNFGALLKTVDRYSGQIAEEDLTALVTMAPFVLVSHTGSQVVATSSTGAQWAGDFTVICGATSLRAATPGQMVSSRVGGASATELGSRPIAEMVRDLLDEQTFGLPMSSLDPLAIEELYCGPVAGVPGDHFFSMTGVRFATKYSTTRSKVGAPGGATLTEIVAQFAPWINGVQADPALSTVTLPLPETDAGDPA